MAATKKGNTYGVDDFVFVTDVAGVVQADAVPKAWVGTDLLPDGWSQATAKEAKEADTNAVEVPAAPVGVVSTDKQA